MKINSILVVGGGSSGWMSAAAFSRYLKGVKVSVVESKTSSPVGVGESTIIPFNQYLEMIGLKDDEWMKHCNATYKASIRFTNFLDKNSGSFEYPFGRQGDNNSIAAWAHLAAAYDLPPESFCEFQSDMYFLAKYNRMSKNEDNELKYIFDEDTAYHFDAKLFGEYLRDHVCKPEGVEHYYDDVVSVEKNDDGYVTSIVGSSGQKYSADLYVDCTGFRSVLLEGEMNSKFISFKHWLSNDSALAAHLPYTNKESQLTNVTNCTAIENGWVWNIPLWSRIGTGYVYSSDFVDDETAAKQFKSHLGVDDIELRKINIKHGYHEHGWIKNVVGVGLSYAFVEPLESTGLVSTHLMIEHICELLERRNYNINGFDIDGYNYNAAYSMNGFKHFVGLHYKFSSRTDTPYWKYQTQEKNWWDLDSCQDQYDFPIPLRDNVTLSFRDPYALIHTKHSLDHLWTAQYLGFAFIMAGMGYKPMGKRLLDKVRKKNPDLDENMKQVYNNFRIHVNQRTEYVNTLPTSYEFLKETIYKD